MKLSPRELTLRAQREAKLGIVDEIIQRGDNLPQRVNTLELTVNTLVNTVNSLQAAVSKLTVNSPDQGTAVAEKPHKPTPTARTSYMRAYMANRRANKKPKNTIKPAPPSQHTPTPK